MKLSTTVKINVIDNPRCREHFETLYWGQEEEEEEHVPITTNSFKDEEVRITNEVKNAIKKLRNRKAPERRKFVNTKANKIV